MNSHLKRFCEHGDIQSLRNIDAKTRSFLIPASKVAKEVHNNNRASIYYGRANTIVDTFTEPKPYGKCYKFYGMRNTSNSCYLDSVLFALFAIPNEFIDRHTINAVLSERPINKRGEWECGKSAAEDLKNRRAIQDSLRDMVEILRKQKDDPTHKCYNLRAMMKNCSNMRRYAGGAQQDAEEFLVDLLGTMDRRIFRAVRHDVSYVTNDIHEKDVSKMVKLEPRVDNLASIVWIVSGIEFAQYPKHRVVDIRQFLIRHEDSGELEPSNYYQHDNGQKYKRRISHSSIYSAPYLIISIQRLNPIDNRKYHTPVYPAEVITLPETQEQFNLSAIVVHSGGGQGGHYTCYIRCENTWISYDDLGGRVREVGRFVDLLTRQEAMTDGTLYYYTRVN